MDAADRALTTTRPRKIVVGVTMPGAFIVNLGGEGEVPGVLNQQGRWVILRPGWRASRTRNTTFTDLIRAGVDFVLSDNDALPFPDQSMDEVITNGVPIDTRGPLGPGIPSRKILRILKSGGVWIVDLGEPSEQRLTKP